MARTYFVQPDDRSAASAAEFTNVQRALDYAEQQSQTEPRRAMAVSDDRGRVFAYFCKHGGMRDSTMGTLLCCEEEV